MFDAFINYLYIQKENEVILYVIHVLRVFFVNFFLQMKHHPIIGCILNSYL